MALSIHGVRSSSAGSRLIRWGADTKASHIVVELPRGLMHSYVQGVVPLSREDFKTNYELVRTVTMMLPTEHASDFEDRFRCAVKGRAYDYRALAFFAWRGVLRKFFGVPWPARNLWDGRGYLCTEAAEALCELYQAMFGIDLIPEGFDDRMLTPDALLDALARCVPAGCAS